MRLLRFFIKTAGVLLLVIALITTGINLYVEHFTKNDIFDNMDELPHNKVALLLGTSKYLTKGTVNLYYKYRIDAAVGLFKAGKVDFILVSGDNSAMAYNEPVTIKKDLVAMGIPSGKIYLDYAGFRTLDSVVRAKEIFGQNSFTIVSQPFHNKRAVFIAKWKKINAVGYNAKDVGFRYGLKIKIREKFARVKMLIDLITGKNPKFLGEKIIIP